MSTTRAKRSLLPPAASGWKPPGPGASQHLATCRTALGSDRAPAYLIRGARVADVIGAIEAEKAGVYA